MQWGTYLALLFPNLSGDEVAVLQLINESLALAVEQETTNTTESLSSEELDLGPWLVGVNQTCRMYLDLLHVDSAGTDGDGDLVSVAGTVITVGGGEFPILWAVLLQQGVFGEVGGVTTSGQDDRPIGGLGLSTDGVLNADNGSTILDELSDAGLLLNDNTLGIADCKVLKTLHLSVGNDLCKRSGSIRNGTQRETDGPGCSPCRGIEHHHDGFVVDCDHQVERPWKGRAGTCPATN
jgi:hypothetical protein